MTDHDNPEMVSIPVNEYEELKNYKRLWDFYCRNAEFDCEDSEYDEDKDEYTYDSESEVIIYTGKTIREEQDFLNTLGNSEECEEGEVSECCCEGECAVCDCDGEMEILVEPVDVPGEDEDD